MKIGTSYEVLWLDHATLTDSRWRSIEETVEELTPVSVVSYGRLIHQEKDYIILASTVDTDSNNVCNEMLILRKAIVNVRAI